MNFRCFTRSTNQISSLSVPTFLFVKPPSNYSILLSSSKSHFPKFRATFLSNPSLIPMNSTKLESLHTLNDVIEEPILNFHDIDPILLEKLLYDALVWCSLHGLVVGHRNFQESGIVPGVGMVHAPVSLLPVSFPESHYRQACDLAPIFNELFDRVSLDAKFLQESLERTRKVDDFTSRLLNIHSKMIGMNKKEEIRLGLHRSDYMLDAQTNSLLQIEFNTISSSFGGLSCLVSELHRNLLTLYGNQLELDFKKVPENRAIVQFAKALAEAWKAYDNPRAVVLVVVQPEERNMYDQHWLSAVLREKYPFIS